MTGFLNVSSWRVAFALPFGIVLVTGLTACGLIGTSASENKPKATDSDVVAAEHRIAPVNQRSLTELTTAITKGDGAVGRVVANGETKSCGNDSNDYSTDDSHDYFDTCIVNHTVVLAGGSVKNFDRDMKALDQRIRTQHLTNWKRYSMAFTLGYWAGRDVPRNPGLPYPSSLPHPQYVPDKSTITKAQIKNRDDGPLVEVAWLQPNVGPKAQMAPTGPTQWRAPDGQTVNEKELLKKTPADSYLVTISMVRPYFKRHLQG